MYDVRHHVGFRQLCIFSLVQQPLPNVHHRVDQMLLIILCNSQDVDVLLACVSLDDVDVIYL